MNDTRLPVIRPGLTLSVYIAAIFLSAALLFAVQPMFTKMVLPRLGGAPTVWSIAIVFFQTALLAGYTYAHLLTRWLSSRQSVIVHVALMSVATLALPLAIARGWGRPPEQGEALWLLGLFTVSIGLPFFALSANGPLLQAWFARSDHPSRHDPYFLYAASNVGSFLALLAYPFAVEPLSRLGDQASIWSILYYLLIVLILICGCLLLRLPQAPQDSGDLTAPGGAAPTWRDGVIWAGLAAVPSGLLVSVTAYISTDVGAVPLLWVVPLALYLLTFVIVFQRRPVIRQQAALFVQAALLSVLATTLVVTIIKQLLLSLALNLLAFFVTALVCHGELARRRPAPRYLTAFYMWMSLGGVIGGIFSALLAPKLFATVAEYPILIVLAILCRPRIGSAGFDRRRLIWLGMIGLFGALIIGLLASGVLQPDDVQFKWLVGAIAVLGLMASRDPLKFAAVISIAFLAGSFFQHDVIRRDSLRSFFGVYKITETADRSYRVLLHGTTIHGAERISEIERSDTERPEPLTYYHETSALARSIAAVRDAHAGGPIHVAVVGLGTGTLACYAMPGDIWHFYEIDIAVIKIARDPSRFSFLAQCAPQASIMIGDARLTLGDSPDHIYDLIVVDAFSSDTIPVHLLTREAMGVYLNKLAPGGLIAMHVSNRHLELASVVAGIASANGLVARTNEGKDIEETDYDQYKFSSTVVVAARNDEDFGELGGPEGWQVEVANPKQRVWTDDYSNIAGAILRQLRQE